MDWDFKKKKKQVIQEDLADDEECKSYEEDAQAYYKSLRAKRDEERVQKEITKKRMSEDEIKRKKERKAYCEEIKRIYQLKAKKKA